MASFEFKLPDLGEGIHEAQVLAWKVTAGQEVVPFQALCEVESAKAAVELTAPVAGRIRETKFAEGAIARLGDVLVVIDTDANGSAPTPRGQRDAPAEASATETEWFGIVGRPPRAAEAPPPSPRGSQGVRAAPFVRKLARDLGVALEDIAGSGPHGRVRIADIEARAAQPAEPVLSPTTIPLRGLRKSIADHMVQAWRSAPQVTSMDLLDVSELVRARDLLVGSAQAQGTRLTYVPFFVKATVEALRSVPIANAVVDEQQSVIRLRQEYHIGIATAVPDGLVVPVVKHADRLSLLEIAREVERLVVAARERRASPADLSGGTFTITSFGGLPGSPMFATPILNYPEVAILGLGRIDLQPRVVEGQVVPRHCIGVSFTFDHRALDGEAAGHFMATLKKYIEQPLELLLGQGHE
ncbi:MAG: 2-oxo acid dehydrogenase subunit E2 [Chloroflexota bacterium]|nr:2-oxo acid dehydrogenase subunit E2 [Chloroflexota bacterium]